MRSALVRFLPWFSAVFGTACMAALLAVLLIRYFASALKPEARAAAFLSRGEPSLRSDCSVSWRGALLWSAVWFAGTRLFLALCVYCYAAWTGRAELFTANLLSFWDKWDAPHYIGLIRNWYVSEGDARYHIVFFPVFPLLARCLLPLLRGNAEAAALIVSNANGWLLGAVLMRLVGLQYDMPTARRAMRYLYCAPMSFFLSIAYTESTFLLLTVLAVYLARRRSFLPALLCGAVCSASRLMGLVVAIPIFYEMLAVDRERGPVRPDRALLRGLSCCAVLVGAAAYLLLNYRVTGNPLQFWIYQRDHWYNTSGTLWNTFGYVMRYALLYESPMRECTWIPTLAALYGAIALVAWNTRRARSGDSAYAWAYLYMTIVPTWLISGPRYVFGLYALYPMLASRVHRRWADAAVSALLLAGLAVMSCAFVFTSAVY